MFANSVSTVFYDYIALSIKQKVKQEELASHLTYEFCSSSIHIRNRHVS